MSSGLLIVISAPSGAGKTTLCDNLLQHVPGVTRAVTCTTRPPREGEIDGVHYHFLSREVFAQKVDAGEFLEHATVYENCYGVLKAEIVSRLDDGADVLLNIDVQGQLAIRAATQSDPVLQKAFVSIFLVTPTWEELEHRLTDRGSEDTEMLARRLKTARHEIAQWEMFDYLLVSQTREEDLRRAVVIIEAEKMRQMRSELPGI